MPIAIFDPFSGISGDMTLGALLDVGLSPDWLRALPATLGIPDVGVRIRDVRRGDIACKKVDFDIPPQPHGRGIREIRALVASAPVPDAVRQSADRAFTLIADCEAGIHGVAPEDVHLHEVGAVDAILDVVGSLWGFDLLGVTDAFTGRVSLGDGTVRAAHGILPVPAPATLKILEGILVSPGPEGAGELVTPTGAALLRILTGGKPTPSYVPTRSGFGAGTKDFPDRANALRLIIAEDVGRSASVDGEAESLALLAADVDDMSPEYLAAEQSADSLEAVMLLDTTTIGVRRTVVTRRALARASAVVDVGGHSVRVKLVTRPDGSITAKPEHDDVVRVAEATGRSVMSIFREAEMAAERGPRPSV
jgi:uncharacterized protein (TIGR00299 family) protein